MYFKVRFEALLEVLKHCNWGTATSHIKLLDFWFRVVFQGRGSPHVHGLVWIDLNMAGIYDLNDAAAVESFCDPIISALHDSISPLQIALDSFNLL